MPPSALLGNDRGLTILYLSLLLALLGALALSGVRQFGAGVQRAKVAETKRVLAGAAQSVGAWGAGKGRLPGAAEYAAVTGGSGVDAWQRPLVYAFDANLAQATGGGICGRSATAISDGANQVAFLLVSGGEDNVASIPGASGPYSGALNGLGAGSISQVVTLKELQEQVGCATASQGRLRLVNNELPSVCRGENYSVSLVGDGGVAPLSYSYSPLPAGLTGTGALLSGTTWEPVGSYPVQVTLTDSQLPSANTMQRSLVLKVISCP